MAVFMKIKGIQGNITSEGYDGWIKLNSIDCGVERAMSTKVGQAADRENSIPRFHEIEITKMVDNSTPALYQYVCTAENIPTV